MVLPHVFILLVWLIGGGGRGYLVLLQPTFLGPSLFFATLFAPCLLLGLLSGRSEGGT